mmetsp:Transcript_34511/g.34162  ORF Transcript_34511/g.34162 Transcript_34511/m.34162 type:complete len:250 (-) Transcript_34511:6-755(-)
MEYILKDMCDKSPYYQFDLPQLTDPVLNPQVQMMMAQSQIDHFAQEQRLQKPKYLKQDKEEASIDSSGYFNGEDSNKMKKRDLKAQIKNIQDFNSSSESKEKRLQRESNSDSSGKLFKIQRVSKNKEESFSNSNGEVKKMSDTKSSEPKGSIMNKPQKEVMLNVKQGNSIVLLNNTKIVIQGTRIESSIPMKLQKYDNDLNLTIPKYPCQVSIEPLTLENDDLKDYGETTMDQYGNFSKEIDVLLKTFC